MARDKCKTNIVVDIAAAVTFLLSLVSGVVLWLILPLGSGLRGGRGLSEASYFLTLGRHGWLAIHIVFSVVVSLLVGYHLILHWCWIKRIPAMMEK